MIRRLPDIIADIAELYRPETPMKDLAMIHFTPGSLFWEFWEVLYGTQDADVFELFGEVKGWDLTIRDWVHRELVNSIRKARL